MTDDLIANRYRPKRVLGEGAMGKVVLAIDETTGEEVALKVIAHRRIPHAGSESGLLRHATSLGEKSAIQFRQEFRLMTQLRHQNCCAVYDYGLSIEGEPFFTMEVVPGLGLEELGVVDPVRFKALFAQLLLALGYIHQQGLVHLDIKSSNVRVRPDDSIKLMDYGLMEYAGQGSGVIRGTLPYISPEMARRAPVDQRADLYSAGVLAYEMLTGRLPFVRQTAVELLRAHLEEAPEPPSRLRRGIPPELDRLVLRLLLKQPVERYQSAAEVLEDLGFEPPPGIGGSLFGSTMVGRDLELLALLDGLEAIQAGRSGGVTHLFGGLGIGKSRLLDEFRVHVQLAHVPFARGTSHEHQRLPYASLIQVLRGLLPVLRQYVPHALEAAAPVLVRLLPELGGAEAVAMESPRHEMLRLQATVTTLMAKLAENLPLVLVLEGWQWADEPTAEFIKYARRNLSEAPIMLLLSTQLSGAVGVSEEATGNCLTLQGLAGQDVRRMVCNMLGTDDIDPAFGDAIASVSARNPLYIERLLDHLVKTGALVRRDSRWITDFDPRIAGLPANLKALVARKLAALPPDVLAVARAMAVYGQPADIEFLEAVTGLVDTRLFDAITALQREQVITQDALQAYVFVQSHDQDVLYSGLVRTARVALHARVAEVLWVGANAQAIAELPTDRVVALAEHFLQGERHENAIVYNLEAGRRAVGLFALADAERFLMASLRLIDQAPVEDRRRERLDCLRYIGEVKRQAGLAQEALGWLGEAVNAAEALGEVSTLGPLLANVAAAHQMLAQYDLALATARRSADLGLAAGDTAAAARAMRAVGRVHFHRSDLAAAKVAGERALELALESGQQGILGLAYAFSGFLGVVLEPERAAVGVERLDKAVALLTTVGDRVGLNDALNLLGNARMMLGDPGRARQAFEASSVICRENGLREEECVALVSLASTAIDLGAYGDARDQAARVRLLASEIGAKLPLGMAMAVEGLAACYLGELEPAESLTAEALVLARDMGNRYLEAVVLPPRIEALVQLGRVSEALVACDELAQLIAETGNTESAGVLLAWQAIAQTYHGHPLLALELIEPARDVAEKAGVKSLLVLLGLAEVHARVAQGDWPAALRTGSQALEWAQTLGTLGRAAELMGLLGEIALATGERGAREHFVRMEAIALETHTPIFEAMALFGRAAAEPYAPEAEGLAKAATAMLQQLTEGAGATTATAYVSLPGRARILANNYIAFGLPRERRRGPPTGGFGLNLRKL